VVDATGKIMQHVKGHAPGSTKKTKGKKADCPIHCPGTVTICDRCFSGYHLQHLLWQILLTMLHGPEWANLIGLGHEYLPGERGEEGADMTPGDLIINKVGRAIGKKMHVKTTEWREWENWGPVLGGPPPRQTFGELTRADVCEEINKLSGADMQKIHKKDSYGKPITPYVNCKPCKDKIDMTPDGLPGVAWS
jgi:hypothetical protein